MVAMWRLLRGHGKPRMFAMLARQRAALAAVPLSPSKALGGSDAAGSRGEGDGKRTGAVPTRRLWADGDGADRHGLGATHSAAAEQAGGSAAGLDCGGGGGITGPAPAAKAMASAVQGGGAARATAPQADADGDGVEMEQLIVGVLLATPLLFLLPTTLVFQAFAALLAAGAAAARAALAAAAEGCVRNPVALLTLRLARGGLFACGLTFEALLSLVPSATTAAAGDTRRRPNPYHRPQLAQTHVRLVSQQTSVAQILAPCCAGVAERARACWARSQVRLPW